MEILSEGVLYGRFQLTAFENGIMMLLAGGKRVSEIARKEDSRVAQLLRENAPGDVVPEFSLPCL